MFLIILFRTLFLSLHFTLHHLKNKICANYKIKIYSIYYSKQSNMYLIYIQPRKLKKTTTYIIINSIPTFSTEFPLDTFVVCCVSGTCGYNIYIEIK